MIRVDIYFDGACRNVKGSRDEPSGCGVAVYIDGEYSEVYSVAFRGDNGTSNIAEWCACVIASKIAKEIFDICIEELERVDIQLYSDSEVITKQANGIYEVREGQFLEYYNISKKYLQAFKSKEIKWIPREKNKQADKLSKEGIKKEFYYYYHAESDCFVIEESDYDIITIGPDELVKQCECKEFSKKELLTYLDSKSKHSLNEDNLELVTREFNHYRSLIIS